MNLIFDFIVSNLVKIGKQIEEKTNKIFAYIIEEKVMKQIEYVYDLYVNILKIKSIVHDRDDVDIFVINKMMGT
jgi:hypothetical protein